ncbi:Membrane protein involved in the export of O-antigen and teichoic acid [Paenibacillus sp. yr247]|uniref:oligosaccharide flippase family protein n=1 Tax=Paenibacillus sp. yr247 TaxID=1761880 RepID=UPI0008921802|nr:oligosaccharide flippase family protein [Paenibacillus sp. yr247]SDN32349.1 Membrane protein involved in the export of O-antigen and teichoic acid [Paenibacillus sp. yr247]
MKKENIAYANRVSVGKPLKINFIWLFGGNMIYAFCQFLYITLITKLGSIEMVGVFSLGLAITAPVFMFSNLQLRIVQVSDSKNEFVFGDFLALRLVSMAFGLLVTFIIIQLFYNNSFVKYIALILAVYKSIEGICDIIFSLFQKNENLPLVSASLILKGILTVVFLTVCMYFFKNLIAVVTVIALVMALILIFVDIKNLRMYNRFQPIFNMRKLKKIFITSLPLGFVTLLVCLNINIPRYFLEQYVGIKELGIFASISNLMIAGATIVSALGQSASPKLVKYFGEGNRKSFTSLLLKMIGIAILVAVCGFIISLLFGERLLVLIFSKDFIGYEHILLITILSAGIGFIASFLGDGLNAARAYKIQVPIIIVSVLSCLVCSYLLIPTKGLEGAAFVLVITSVLNMLLMGIILIGKIRKMKKPITLVGMASE